MATVASLASHRRSTALPTTNETRFCASLGSMARPMSNGSASSVLTSEHRTHSTLTSFESAIASPSTPTPEYHSTTRLLGGTSRLTEATTPSKPSRLGCLECSEESRSEGERRGVVEPERSWRARERERERGEGGKASD
eukprot:1996550-Pleurochrysis_carterae.AAC.1